MLANLDLCRFSWGGEESDMVAMMRRVVMGRGGEVRWDMERVWGTLVELG
jgi:hypothetical protein